MGRTLGAPDALTSSEAQQISDFIRACWRLQHNADPSDLDSDLERLKTYFDPVARGGRLREALQELPQLLADPPDALDQTAIIRLGDQRYLITPEGRGLLQLVDNVPPDAHGVVRISTEAREIELQVADRIRQWSRHRLLDVISKQRGEGPPMLPVAAAIVLLLLINGSTSPETAVRRLSDRQRNASLDAIIADILLAFADTLDSQGHRDRSQMSLWQGYALTEARRRLPGLLVVNDNGLFIRAAQVERVINFVANDLARRGLSPAVVVAAYDALLSAYRDRLKALANFDSGFERIGMADDIRRALIDASASD